MTTKPRDALAIQKILQSSGIESYDPAVVNLLLEFYHRHVSEVLEESEDYRHHRDSQNKPAKRIGVSDVLMTNQAKSESTFITPPPWQVVSHLANTCNNIPLDIIPVRWGVLLPPEKNRLTSPNYQITKDDDDTLL